ncbi:MAG: hypothetical protein NT019_01970 [Candidatus Adlerbacteria bacterium]|nr:hypothetical protein [Candidatus Adlerbacteria bacterium]
MLVVAGQVFGRMACAQERLLDTLLFRSARPRRGLLVGHEELSLVVVYWQRSTIEEKRKTPSLRGGAYVSSGNFAIEVHQNIDEDLSAKLAR